MSEDPGIHQNPLTMVAVGSTIVGLPLVGLPTFLAVLAVNALAQEPMDFTIALACGLLTGTVGQFVARLVQRPLERRGQRSVVHGFVPTLTEILPSLLICSVVCGVTFGSGRWFLLGALAGLLGLIPSLLITRPWSEGCTEEEFQRRNKAFKTTLHRESEILREDMRAKKHQKGES